MSSKVRWSLPDGVDEFLPPKAIEVEKLRRKLIDEYIDSGYEFIIPPLLELSESIGGEAHDEIQSYAFTFKDNVANSRYNCFTSYLLIRIVVPNNKTAPSNESISL